MRSGPSCLTRVEGHAQRQGGRGGAVQRRAPLPLYLHRECDAMGKGFGTLLSAAWVAMASAGALGQGLVGSGFTYQGRLESGGAVVNGTADFQFRLFDAVTGGVQVGALQAVSNVSLAAGLFTTELDFGGAAFNGDARYLEIAVRRPAGTGSFVTLSPRQRLTAAPYALKVPGIDGNSLNSANGS